jgi:hypothetical protein
MMSLVGVGHRKVHVFDKSLGGAKAYEAGFSNQLDSLFAPALTGLTKTTNTAATVRQCVPSTNIYLQKEREAH